MAIRLSGLTSGLDTDAIVQEMVSAYSLKTEKYEKQQTKLTWKQESWKDLNTKIYGLYTNVSNLRYSSAYNLRKTTLSDNTKATVTASGEAVTGTQMLNILQTAQASYITGNKLEGDIKTTTKMSELGYTGGETSIEVLDADGESHEIKITKATTVNEVVAQLKEAGLNANFDETNKRFFISAKESGIDNDFNLYANNDNGEEVLKLLGLNTSLVKEDGTFNQAGEAKYGEAYKLYQAAEQAGMSVEDYLEAQVQEYENLEQEYHLLIIDRAEQKAKLEEYNELMKDPDANKDALAGFDIDEINEKIASFEAEMAERSKEIDAHKYRDLALSKTKDVEIAQLANEANQANNVLNDPDSKKSSAIKITGQNAIIELNGATFENATNSFSINGLTINAQAVTTAGPISITTNVDTQGIYDKVKDFLTEYNTLVNEMTKLYNADSARDYEPLTDEEREAMSDDQIEKWENKIKSALLRRDGTLNSILSGMVNAMASTYEVNGEKLSLSTFGISTLGFLNAADNEHYAYHIDGDEDDENTSGKEDKLMEAIEENPDQVLEFMKKLASGLYSSIDEKMKSTELSSAYKVYNDKEIDKEISNYADIIKKWEAKVTEKENYYYDKFTQMEVALGKLQNQTSSISGLLGA